MKKRIVFAHAIVAIVALAAALWGCSQDCGPQCCVTQDSGALDCRSVSSKAECAADETFRDVPCN